MLSRITELFKFLAHLHAHYLSFTVFRKKKASDGKPHELGSHLKKQPGRNRILVTKASYT